MQGGPRIGVAHEAASLQRRHQPLTDLIDEAAGDALERGADQETVAADRLDCFCHELGNVVWAADQVQPTVKTLRGELTQRLAAAPLREFVERALLAIGGDMRQWRVEIELGGV